jgi:hypothetical protein
MRAKRVPIFRNFECHITSIPSDGIQLQSNSETGRSILLPSKLFDFAGGSELTFLLGDETEEQHYKRGRERARCVLSVLHGLQERRNERPLAVVRRRLKKLPAAMSRSETPIKRKKKK